MTLDEAIAHAREVAKELKKKAELADNTDLNYTSDYCLDCAEDHEQLASWLEELKARREADRWIPVSERLPETTNLILLSVRHETPTRTHTAVYGGYYDGKFLTVNSVAVEGCFVEGCNTKVIAWRSLPEPYKESEGA